jgi:hypothetical protein
MINIKSPYSNYANQILYWLPMDTEILYQINLREHKEKIILNGWLDFKITYKFNSHGFRCEEFSESPSIMTIGCSNTCGIGLPIEHTWSNIVANNLNLHLSNLGIGGYSNDTAFRLCYGWIDKIKPKVLIFLQTPPSRSEIVTPTSFNTVCARNHSKYEKFYKDWISDESNDQLNSLKNSLAVQQLCSSRGIKFLSFNSDTFRSFEIDKARDLTHCGTKSNFAFSQHVLKHL